jgi:hypothetical protein
MIIVLVPIHQPTHNFVLSCMFNILMTCTTIHFHFLQKFGRCINQTPNLHSIPTRFNFHVSSLRWVFPNTFYHYFIHTQICPHTLVEISQNVSTPFTTTSDLYRLQLDLGIFATTRPNFNYFGHFHNYDATIRNFILLVRSNLHLLSSINRLICLINRDSHQISCMLKVFYNDIEVYFNICTKFIYIVHIMNLRFIFEHWILYSNLEIDISILKTNILIFIKYIRIWNLIFDSENCYFNYLKHYLNFKILIWIWYFQFIFKRLIWSKNCYLNSKLIFFESKT